MSLCQEWKREFQFAVDGRKKNFLNAMTLRKTRSSWDFFATWRLSLQSKIGDLKWSLFHSFTSDLLIQARRVKMNCYVNIILSKKS
jgi:hypothetical protein